MSKRISIEVGHGGSDHGATFGDLREKDITLTMSLELMRQLRRHDCEVLISRTTDVNDPAAAFFARATAFNPDVGISVHVNAGGGNGFEAFHQTNELQARSIALCRAIADRVRAAGQVLRNPAVRNVNAFPTPTGQNFVRLMNTVPGPYAYCELGFIDSPSDRARWDATANQRRFATAYARGILEFLGVVWIDEGQSQPSTGITYTIRQGDTMTSIARNHGITLEALVAANPQISNPDLIIPGHVIRIPGAGTAPTRPVAPAVNWETEVNHVANEIVNGRNAGGWGNNPQRRQRLIEHGNRTFGSGQGTRFADVVQARVNVLVR